MHVYKRYDSEKRRLAGPLLFFNLDEEFTQLKEDPEWSARHRNAVTLLKEPHLSVVLVGLQKGAALSKHKAQGPVTICVLIGAVSIKTEHESRTLHSHGMLSLERDIPHEVEALEESAVLVTIAEPKP
jgi:quercetin dioxygenase-like cupin family protein